MAEFFRFYKNEKECPFPDKENEKQALWDYERCYKLDGDKKFLIDEYAHFMKDYRKNDGVPEGYKALLFNRYMNGVFSIKDAVDDFKAFYEKYYG